MRRPGRLEIAGIPLLFLEDGLLVADKPSGLLSQPGLGAALSDSLLTRVQQEWPCAELIHRLDRDTSGLLLLATDREVHRAMSRLFAERRVAKTYRADVAGVPGRESGSIRLAIAKYADRPPRYRPDGAGKPCHTDWLMTESCGGWSRLKLTPHTGRSHQLRVHLAAIGHPILGDPLYGSVDTDVASGAEGVNRLRLHASELAFEHPLSGKPLSFRSPCPF